MEDFTPVASTTTGKDGACRKASLKELYQSVLVQAAELVYWRDPKNTGIVFGLGLVILLSLSIFSVISVVAYTLLFTLLGTLSFRVYKNVLQAVQKTSEGHPFKEYLEIEIAPSQERINEIVASFVSHGTCFINRMRSVLLVEDIVDSLKYLLIFWALTYIGAWFNGLTLVILAYIAAFSLPKVYEQNKTQIDQYLDLINSKITELTDKVPFLKKPVPVEKKDE
ncbi:hypothetical protein RDWZM_008518 [Blomia tropicalis]|uniref:Reticulon-like protein n=1 Tax=Blomia tropicalis TaxID=40697 RepID=A0A9Q0RLH6_BLOTA|nr:Reticulon-like protein [Blomia tropicalis]KAJ6217361.1 hypothetical protein RDWZM_008518 [Blomia tropicalis]